MCERVCEREHTDRNTKRERGREEGEMERPREGRGERGAERTTEERERVLIPKKIFREKKIHFIFHVYKNYKFILIYILPPHPIFPHLAARLAERNQKTGENFKLTIKSTLGSRQLKEFNSIKDSINKDIDVIFLINDKIKRVVKKLKKIIV